MKKLNLFPQASRAKLQPFVLLICSTHFGRVALQGLPQLVAPARCNPNPPCRSKTLLWSTLLANRRQSPSCLDPRAQEGLLPAVASAPPRLDPFSLGRRSHRNNRQTRLSFLNKHRVTYFWRKTIPRGRSEAPQLLISTVRSNLTALSCVKPSQDIKKLRF